MKEDTPLTEFLCNIKMEAFNISVMQMNLTEKISLKEELKKIKEKLEKYETKLNQKLKENNIFMVAGLTKIENISQIKSMKTIDYTAAMVKDVLINDFTYLITYTKEMISYMSKQEEYTISHILLKLLLYLEDTLYQVKLS
jgi:DNA-binding ferritin-like protein